MMLRNALLVLGTLTLIAGAVLAVLWIRLPSPKQSELRNAGQHAAILVAATDIPAGTLLRAGNMAWRDVEPASITPDEIVKGRVSETSYYGAVARSSIAVGLPLKTTALVQAGARNFLAAVLAPGMQAESLAVDDSQSVAGLIQAGDHVDAVLTQAANDSNGNTSAVSETILRNARVVAVDQAFGQSAKPAAADSRFSSSGNGALPKEITLELGEIDAKRLLVAIQLGRVTLVLRALEGKSGPTIPVLDPDAPIWAADVSAAVGGSRQGAAGPRAAQVGSREAVQIVRGSKSETH